MNQDSHPTWIEIDLSAVEHNVKYLLNKTQKPLMAVVKGNAYGLGSVKIGKAALEAGASWLGVARYGEAQVLRDAGISAPILVLGMVTPEEVKMAIQNDISVNLHGMDVARIFSESAKSTGKKVKAHLKVDSGMGRLGVYAEDAVKLAQYALELGGIELEGVFSHFAMASYSEHPHTKLQTERFAVAVESLKEAGLLPKWVHLANSAGAYYEADSYFNMVRAGSAVTGIKFRDDQPYPDDLCRCLTWKAKLASCKVLKKGWGVGYGLTYTTSEDEIIGSIPVGYGDGYRRGMGNEVLIDGQRIPVVGRECMDQTMLRLPKEYPIGTEVVLIGTQGNESIYLEDVAQKWDTVEVDVTTIINQRVPRIYK